MLACENDAYTALDMIASYDDFAEGTVEVEAQGLFPLRPQAGSGSQACPSGQVIRAKKLEEIAVKVVKE